LLKYAAGFCFALGLVLLHVWRGEIPEVDASQLLLRCIAARDAWKSLDFSALLSIGVQPVPNPGWMALWIGLWMVVLGPWTWVGVLALAPWAVALVVGLWEGGETLGGKKGALLAVLLGAGHPMFWYQGHRLMLDLPLTGAVVLSAAWILQGRSPLWAMAMALPVKLAAVAGLAGMGLDSLFSQKVGRWRLVGGLAVVGLVLYGPGLPQLLDYARGNANIPREFVGVAGTGARLKLALSFLPALVGPVGLIAVVGALLTSPKALRPLLWSAAYLLGISLLTQLPQPRYLLPLWGLWALAGGALGGVLWRGRPVVALLVGLLALGRWGVPLLDSGVTLAPVQDLAQLDGLLDQIEGGRGPAPRLRVAVELEPGGVLSVAGLQARAIQRALPLDFLNAHTGIAADWVLVLRRGGEGTAVGEYRAQWGTE
jgi:hypothetical protein